MIHSILERNIMTSHDESHIIRTSPKRMAQGLAIMVIVIAVCTVILVPNWNQMAKNPPPVSSIVSTAALLQVQLQKFQARQEHQLTLLLKAPQQHQLPLLLKAAAAHDYKCTSSSWCNDYYTKRSFYSRISGL